MDADELHADVTWVTPTRRLARYLRVRFDEACAARGLAVWRSPEIVTWGDLIERMFALDRQAGRLRGRWLPAHAAQLVWERIVRSDAEAGALVAPTGVGRAAYQAWRRMQCTSSRLRRSWTREAWRSPRSAGGSRATRPGWITEAGSGSC